MRVVINDLSFEGQFSDDEEAISALEEMVKVSSSKKFGMFSGKTILFAEEDLKHSLVTKTKTILTLLQEMGKKSKPHLEPLQTLLLQFFIQNTQVIEEEKKDKPITFNGREITNTSLNFSFSQNIHHALFSCKSASDFNQRTIQVELNGIKCNTLNILDITCIEDLTWLNKPNDRKHVTKDVRYGKNTASRMDLDDDESQYGLSNSVRLPNNGASLYLKDKQWYKFYFEAKNIAHGFCEDTPKKQTHFSLAEKVFNELNEDRIGQIFIEYTKFSP